VPAAARVGLPALLLTGDRDEIVPRAAVEEVFGSLAGPRDRRRYAQGWHLLFRDRQAPRVWRDVADWVLARPPPGPRGAGPSGPAAAACAAPGLAARAAGPDAAGKPRGGGAAARMADPSG
jgi:hypothetical protein